MYRLQGKIKEKDIPVDISFHRITNISKIAEGTLLSIQWKLESKKGSISKSLIYNGEAVWNPVESVPICTDFVKNPKTNIVDAKKLVLNIKEYGAENQKSKQIASTTLNLCDYCFSDGSIVSIPIVLNGVNSILEMTFKFMRPGTLRSPRSPSSDVGSTGNIGSLLKTLSASVPRSEDAKSEEVKEQNIEVAEEENEIYEEKGPAPKQPNMVDVLKKIQDKSGRRGTAGKLPPHASKNYGSVNGVVAAMNAQKEEDQSSNRDSKLGQIESVMEDESSEAIDGNISSSPSGRGYSNIPRVMNF